MATKYGSSLILLVGLVLIANSNSTTQVTSDASTSTQTTAATTTSTSELTTTTATVTTTTTTPSTTEKPTTTTELTTTDATTTSSPTTQIPTTSSSSASTTTAPVTMTTPVTTNATTTPVTLNVNQKLYDLYAENIRLKAAVGILAALIGAAILTTTIMLFIRRRRRRRPLMDYEEAEPSLRRDRTYFRPNSVFDANSNRTVTSVSESEPMTPKSADSRDKELQTFKVDNENIHKSTFK